MAWLVSGEQVIERPVFSYDDDPVLDRSLRLRRRRLLSLNRRSEYHLRERQKRQACARAAKCAICKATSGERHASEYTPSVLFFCSVESSGLKLSKSEREVTVSYQPLMTRILRAISIFAMVMENAHRQGSRFTAVRTGP